MTTTLRARGRALAAGSAILALTLMAVPGPVVAKDGDIIRRGSCTGASDWKLKLSEEDGRIEVEFEVDQNRNGRSWNWRLRNDGVRFAKGTARTKAPSGSFEVRRLTTDGRGKDVIRARAKNPATGEICRGKATF